MVCVDVLDDPFPRAESSCDTLNDVPQPHVLCACGLVITKPLLKRLVS